VNNLYLLKSFVVVCAKFESIDQVDI